MEERVRRQGEERENRGIQPSQEAEQREYRMAGRLEARQQSLPYGVMAVVVLLWLVSLPLINPREMTDLGLLAVLPVTFYAGLVLLLVSFCLLVFRHPQRVWALTLHLIILITMIHATPAIRYGTLRYSWAWKHVGIVDYIQRYGSVNPDISFLNAYHNWPGFFALNAMLTEVAGLETPLSYAPWASLVFNLLFLGSLMLIYRSLSSDRRLVWMAALIFFLTDWVGQDYFAPQSFAYFFYLTLLGILLGWFRSGYPPEEKKIRRWLRLPRLSRFVHQFFERTISTGVVQPSTPVQRLILMGIAILLMMVITFSHQLTPLITIIALALLVLFQMVNMRGTAVLMFILTTAWIWLMATSFMSDNLISLLSSFGTVEENVSENLINLAEASQGQVIVSMVGRGLTLLVIVLAGLGFLRRLRSGHLDLAAMLLVIAPFFLLAANSYGGEILFRVYFFGLPFMAFFIASLVYPTPDSGRSWITPVMTIGLSVTLLGGFMFGYYGKEKQYYFAPGEVAAAEYLFENAPAGSLIVEGTRNYPTLFRNYEMFTYVPIAREPVDNRIEIVEEPVEVLSRWMTDRTYPAAYLLITRSMKAEVDMVGAMPPGSLDEIEEALKRSDSFEVLYGNADATIFVISDAE